MTDRANPRSDGSYGPDDPLVRALRDRFPDMRPVKSPPSLLTMNGCGSRVYGQRDYDAATQTYVMTHYMCFLFIPVLPLAAYRVADAPSGGWYFIGRHPLPPFARAWIAGVVLVITALVGNFAYQDYLESPGYRAGQMIEEARRVAATDPEKALDLYVKAGVLSDSHRETVASEGGALLQRAYDEATLEGRLALVEIASSTAARSLGIASADDAVALATHLFDATKARDPGTALSVLAILLKLGAKEYAVHEKPLLRSALARDPRDLNRALRLASLLETDETARAERVALLMPVKDDLGEGEGARILGQGLAQSDRFDEARPYLLRYYTGRLKSLHEASARYDKLVANTRRQAFDALDDGRAGDAWYRRYDNASDEKQQEMVDAYVANRLKHSGTLASWRKKLADLGEAVPAALDFGTSLLHHARTRPSPEREEILEEAEEIFLALGGAADESPEYQLEYGRVLYWLGRPEEGRALFDRFLENQKRGTDAVTAVAERLREVGRRVEARELLERAYAEDRPKDEKASIASSRALMYLDNDDQIAWLERSDTEDKYIRASLEHARGEKLIEQGRPDEATVHLRKSLSVSASFEQSSATYNNRALVGQALFQCTGDPRDFRSAAEWQEKALALAQPNSIVLYNTAYTLTELAFLNALEERVEYQHLHCEPQEFPIGLLCADAAERAPLIARISNDPAFTRARDLLKRARVLAPGDSRTVEKLAHLYATARDAEAMEALLADVRDSSLDVATMEKDAKDRLEGRRGDSYEEGLRNRAALHRKLLGELPADAEATTRLALIRWLVYDSFELDDSAVPFEDALTWERELRDAYAASPSATVRNLLESYAVRAVHTRLAKVVPEYGRAFDSALNGSSHRDALVFWCARSDESREVAAATPAMQVFKRLFRERMNAFPDRIDARDWAFADVFMPEEGHALRRAARDNATDRAHTHLIAITSPYSLGAVLCLYWLHRCDGQDGKAAEVLAAARERGLRIP